MTGKGGSELEKAIFAAGCFWHVELEFSHVKGVTSTRVGYSGGTFENPTYQDVHTGKTGHAESVEVDYDPSIIPYEKLLDVFWGLHDPTQANRQGPDVGSQYRSAIFFLTPEQRTAAIASRDALQASGKYKNKKIVTEISAARKFWPAEEYHQKYLEKQGMASCGI